MKTSIILLAFMTSLLFVSCKNDNSTSRLDNLENKVNKMDSLLNIIIKNNDSINAKFLQQQTEDSLKNIESSKKSNCDIAVSLEKCVNEFKSFIDDDYFSSSKFNNYINSARTSYNSSKNSIDVTTSKRIAKDIEEFSSTAKNINNGSISNDNSRQYMSFKVWLHLVEKDIQRLKSTLCK